VSAPENRLTLADYREQVAAMYLSDLDLEGFRLARDRLFATHPQSPIAPEEREAFTGCHYFAPNPDATVVAPVRPARGAIEIDSGGPDGLITYERVGLVDTPWGELTLFWYQAYGGGLFLPFRDETRHGTPHTYGAGRYLTDTVKGTFGRGVVVDGSTVTLDFNHAYNPSCAYDDRWQCPLASEENRLGGSIPAGELAYKQ
jgi:uncharacterized protein